MKEQSHKDEMSAALRGDFERLRKRGVAATLAPTEGGPELPEDTPAGVAGKDDPEPRRGSVLGRIFGR
jgi:hypothetical protein